MYDYNKINNIGHQPACCRLFYWMAGRWPWPHSWPASGHAEDSGGPSSPKRWSSPAGWPWPLAPRTRTAGPPHGVGRGPGNKSAALFSSTSLKGQGYHPGRKLPFVGSFSLFLSLLKIQGLKYSPSKWLTWIVKDKVFKALLD